MKYFKAGGWWLPDHEAHLQGWMTKVGDRRGDRLLYQGAKYRMALAHTKRRRVAVDIGAHVGLWSWQMAQDFDVVEAFEPVPAHAECFARNLEGCAHVTLRQVALGDAGDFVTLRTRTPDSSGDTGVEPDGSGDVRAPLFRLDQLTINDIDLIKLDCEGYELFALRGAEQTLRHFRPTVIVEQKPETGMVERYHVRPTEAVEYLKSLGARQLAARQGDYVMGWP
ncbi:MAG: FkbM family methyltransferase [Rhodospirillaceae bacterium]